MSSKSVRFAGPVKSNKRSRNKISVVGGSLDNTSETDDGPNGRDNSDDVKKKRPRVETADGDDTTMREDDNDTNHVETGDASGILSEKELLQAKRKRSLQRDLEFQKGGTHIDYSTSLAAEEGDASTKVEPFHMRAEEEDGAGYFDGETYVFRSQNNVDEEPDAWLDDLQEKQGSHVRVPLAGQKSVEEDDSGQSDDEEEGLGSDDLNQDALYRKIVQLLEGIESVSQALRRYGQQCQKTNHRGKHKAKRRLNAPTKSEVGPPDEAQLQAKKNLDDLTSAANALLLQGEVDIYQTSRTVLLSKLSTTLAAATARQPDHPKATKPTKEAPADWEYQGNQDDQVHGPYTTTQMIDWTQAGYFVGNQKVKVRTIRREQVSAGDDLMADLMDDEDDSPPSENLVKGDWVWSTDVNFHSYAVDS